LQSTASLLTGLKLIIIDHRLHSVRHPDPATPQAARQLELAPLPVSVPPHLVAAVASEAAADARPGLAHALAPPPALLRAAAGCGWLMPMLGLERGLALGPVPSEVPV